MTSIENRSSIDAAEDISANIFIRLCSLEWLHKSENSSFLEAVSIFENSPTLRSVDVFKFWFSINF